MLSASSLYPAALLRPVVLLCQVAVVVALAALCSVHREELPHSDRSLSLRLELARAERHLCPSVVPLRRRHLNQRRQRLNLETLLRLLDDRVGEADQEMALLRFLFLVSESYSLVSGAIDGPVSVL